MDFMDAKVIKRLASLTERAEDITFVLKRKIMGAAKQGYFEYTVDGSTKDKYLKELPIVCSGVIEKLYDKGYTCEWDFSKWSVLNGTWYLTIRWI